MQFSQLQFFIEGGHAGAHFKARATRSPNPSRSSKSAHGIKICGSAMMSPLLPHPLQSCIKSARSQKMPSCLKVVNSRQSLACIVFMHCSRPMGLFESLVPYVLNGRKRLVHRWPQNRSGFKTSREIRKLVHPKAKSGILGPTYVIAPT